jgi:hypothetical protein
MSVLMSFLLIILTTIAANGGQSQTQSQNAKPKFAITISTPQGVFSVSSDIAVDISLTNRSGRKIKMYWPNNGEASDSEYVMRVFDESGKTPPRTRVGRNIIDNDPGIRTGNIEIANRDVGDGEVLKHRLVITKFFDLSKPGKYTIQLERGEGETAVKSNTITATVTP